MKKAAVTSEGARRPGRGRVGRQYHDAPPGPSGLLAVNVHDNVVVVDVQVMYTAGNARKTTPLENYKSTTDATHARTSKLQSRGRVVASCSVYPTNEYATSAGSARRMAVALMGRCRSMKPRRVAVARCTPSFATMEGMLCSSKNVKDVDGG